MKKIRNRVQGLLFLAAFGLLLLWPLLVLVGLAPWKIDTFENRLPSTLPMGITSIDDWVKWPRRFDSFVDDHLPNRSILLRLNSWVKYHLFATSPVDSVLVGKEGWLFHRMPADLLEVEGRLQRKPYQIRRLRVVLEERRDWLAERGIDYLVLIAPTKQSIYPEKLPQWLNPSKSNNSRRKMLRAELQRVESSLKLFDFTPVLLESKEKCGDALFYRHDSHWTYLGALQAYAALSRRYPQWFQEPTKDWKEVQTPRKSNLMHLMGLPGQETAGYSQPPDGFAARNSVPDTELLKSMAKRGAVSVYQRPGFSGPSLHLMGDSFAGWITAYLSENFSRTILTNTWGDQWTRYEQFPTKIIQAERPALVIDQMLENRLDLGIHRNLLGDSGGKNHPPGVRSARLRRLLLNSGATDADYRRQGDELQIQAPNTEMAAAYIVRIELETNKETLVQSISPYPEEAAWSDLCERGGELTQRKVEPGRSEVLLCMTPMPDTGVMRLRLASQGDRLRILSISISRHSDV